MKKISSRDFTEYTDKDQDEDWETPVTTWKIKRQTTKAWLSVQAQIIIYGSSDCELECSYSCYT